MRQTSRKGNIRGLIGFELFLKTACLSFCVPLMRNLFDFCLRAAGYSYLTKENMWNFLVSPCVLCCVGLLVTAAAFLVLFELNAVNLVAENSYNGVRITFVDLFFEGAKRTVDLFRRKRSGGSFILLCLLFVVAVNFPLVLFFLFGFTQTEAALRTALQPMLVIGVAVFVAVAVGGVLLGYKKVLFGLLGRGLFLFVLEGIFYFIGLVILVAAVLKGVPSELSGVLLMHTFGRYHLIFGVLSVSVNTVIYEYFCIGLYLQEYGERVPFLKEREAIENTETRKLLKEKQKRIFLWFAIVVLSVTALVETVSFFRNGSVLLSEALEGLCITAHRGASDNAPENTMAAIAMAVEEAADYVEIDVRLTADGVPVLLHDNALFRTTRVLKDLDDVSYAELSGYDAGSSYSAEFAGECVPCLADVLDRFGGKIGFNIELKTEDEALAESVVALIEAYGMEESCIISSVYYGQLERVKEYNEEIKTGYILSMVYGNFYETKAADFFSIRSSFVTESVVKQAHAQGKEVHAWTVNREKELKRMKAIGVDNIITDKPAYARDTLHGNVFADTLEEWIRLLTLKN